MNLCIVSETFWPEINGVANTLHHIVKGLARLNYKVQLICPAYQGRNQNSIERHFDGKVDFRACRSFALPGYHEVNVGLPSKRLLQRAWRQQRPDAIYVATEGPLGWQAVKLARAMGLHVLSGFHTNFHAYSRYYGMRLMEKLVQHYLVSIHNKTANTIVPSLDQANRVRDMGIRDVAIMGRGVDTELYSPRLRSDELRTSWGVGDSGKVLLYVGRLAKEKNIALAIRSFRQMSQQNASLRMVLVGDGPMKASLQQENPDLIFTGAKHGVELAQCYASADVFVFPSLTETFGNVVLEAMASGLGVVAFNYAAAKQHIENLQNGISVAISQEMNVCELQFVDAVETLCRNDVMLHKIKQRAVMHAQQYSWDVIVKRFLELMGMPTDTEFDDDIFGDWVSLSELS